MKESLLDFIKDYCTWNALNFSFYTQIVSQKVNFDTGSSPEVGNFYVQGPVTKLIQTILFILNVRFRKFWWIQKFDQNPSLSARLDFFRYKSHGYIGFYYLEWSETDQTSQLPNHLEKMVKFVDICSKITQNINHMWTAV